MKKEKRKNLILLMFFFPVYFTPSGIYQSQAASLVESTSGNIIFPFTVLLGLYSLVKISTTKINNPKLRLESKISRMVTILIYLVVMHMLLGYALYQDTTSVILNLQYLSGLLGIFIAIYLVNYKKLNVEKMFFVISVIFLFAIISNVGVSVSKVGLEQTFSRNIYGATILGGIHHKIIYYPFIVSIIFLFALPEWEKRSGLMIPVYFLITTYILILQVRGAVVSYLVGLVLYFMFFSKKSKTISLSSILLIFISIISLFPKDILFGRFMNKSSSLVSGREVVWKVYFENLIKDPLYIIRGSYSKASTSYLSWGNPLEEGIHSYHNQYLEILDSYGFFLFVFFLSILIYYIILNWRKTKKIKNNEILKYWLILTIIHMVIDLNINVPIRITNPAIIYLFYWTSLSLLIQKEYNKLL